MLINLISPGETWRRTKRDDLGWDGLRAGEWGNGGGGVRPSSGSLLAAHCL